MLPHWQRFGSSLSGRTNVERVEFHGISLPVPVLDIILPALQSMDNLTHLSFNVVKLRDDGLLRLSSFLRKNTSLRHLNFSWKQIGSFAVTGALSEAIKNHPTLGSSIRQWCNQLGTIALAKLESSYIIIWKLLEGSCRVEELILRLRPGHEPAGVTVGAEFISSNRPIEGLRLQHNNLSDNDTLLLASALKKNSHLKWLNLQNNNITEEGEKNLLKALFDPSSMDSIIESNHICIPYTYDTDKPRVVARRPLIETEVFLINNWDISTKQKIRQKLVLALCGVDGSLFDLSHLNDLPLPLMPLVLELIQEHTTIRTACGTTNHQGIGEGYIVKTISHASGLGIASVV